MSATAAKANPGAADPGAQANNLICDDACNLSCEQVCVNPVTREELHELTGAVLAAMDLPEVVKEMRAEVQSLRNLVDVQIEILKGFSDLYLELTDKAARWKFLERSILKAERTAARDRIPVWFWRPEPELTLKEQLVRRARWLRSEKYGLDDSWDLLKEFLADWAKPQEEISDERLSRLVGHVFGRRAA